MKRLKQYQMDFVNALSALEEAVTLARTDLETDGAIQRFEFTYEVFWKFLRAYLQEQGVLATTPKECFKEAFGTGVLKNQEAALKMVDDRNLAVHLYDRRTSRQVFDRIRSSHIVVFKNALEAIRKKSSPPG